LVPLQPANSANQSASHRIEGIVGALAGELPEDAESSAEPIYDEDDPADQLAHGFHVLPEFVEAYLAK
jgi:hypothetical protein